MTEKCPVSGDDIRITKKVLVLRSDASKIFQCCQSSLQRIKSNLPSLQRSLPVQCCHAKLARSKMSQRRQDKYNKHIIKIKLRNVSHLSKRLDNKNSCALSFKISLLICSVHFPLVSLEGRGIRSLHPKDVAQHLAVA